MSRLRLPLWHDAYRTAVRLPKYNGPCTVFGALTDQDAARVLRVTAPHVSRAQHAVLSADHHLLSVRHHTRWGRALDQAAMNLFGRPFCIEDYRVSAIGLDAFDEKSKRKARLHGVSYWRHAWLARAHAYAAGLSVYRRHLRSLLGARPS